MVIRQNIGQRLGKIGQSLRYTESWAAHTDTPFSDRHMIVTGRFLCRLGGLLVASSASETLEAAPRAHDDIDPDFLRKVRVIESPASPDSLRGIYGFLQSDGTIVTCHSSGVLRAVVARETIGWHYQCRSKTTIAIIAGSRELSDEEGGALGWALACHQAAGELDYDYPRYNGTLPLELATQILDSVTSREHQGTANG